MHIRLCKATGRASCRLCGRKIAKDMWCIKAIAWHDSGYCHRNCNISETAYMHNY